MKNLVFIFFGLSLISVDLYAARKDNLINEVGHSNSTNMIKKLSVVKRDSLDNKKELSFEEYKLHRQKILEKQGKEIDPILERRRFEKLDANGDGSVTIFEMRSGRIAGMQGGMKGKKKKKKKTKGARQLNRQ